MVQEKCLHKILAGASRIGLTGYSVDSILWQQKRNHFWNLDLETGLQIGYFSGF